MALFDPGFSFNYDSQDFAARQAASNAQREAESRSSSGRSVADTSDLDAQIKTLEKAMKEASGFKRKELQARLSEAKADREARIRSAEISAEASRYGSDKSLEGTRYTADAGERNSQRSLEGTKYSADRSLEGTRYSSDSSAAASRYGTDADLYKFNAEQPTKRAEQALSFLKTYTDLSSRPDSFLQASNYARLGRQVEGMPGMLSDLLGNVNPNGAPVGGNVAFRSGGALMPATAGQAIFGDNPLNLGTRAPAPAMPVWYGPQGQGSTTGMMSPVFANASFAPSYGNDHRGKIVSDSYGAQAGLPASMVPQAPQRAQATGQEPATTFAGQPVALGGLTSSQPRILDDGRFVADYDPSEEAFKTGVRDLMQRGAHQWGNQALERMTSTERDMLASGIKAAGGVPQDYFEAYARSRIGNEGTGRAL